MTAAEIITLRYKEFSGVSAPDVALYLGLVDEQISTSKWGKLKEQLRAALAAHLMWLDGQHLAAGGALAQLGGAGAVSGAITSVKTGDLAASFADDRGKIIAHAGSLEDASLAQSRYGQEFLRLRAKRTVGVLVV